MGGLHVAAQHLPWVALERCAVEAVDVAEHPRLGGAGFAPRDQLERVGVGDRQHVGFLDAREPVDRRAVEGHAVLERVLELGRADREALEVAEHVGEPQAHESHATLFHGAQHVVAMLIEQSLTSPVWSARRPIEMSRSVRATHIPTILDRREPRPPRLPFYGRTPSWPTSSWRSLLGGGFLIFLPVFGSSDEQTTSVISPATMYGSQLAFGRRSSA